MSHAARLVSQFEVTANDPAAKPGRRTTPSRAAFVVMAGGKGERLWPLVRSSVPKVGLSVDGKRTLLEATIDRLAPLVRHGQLMIGTTAPQATAVRRLLPAALQAALLVEPQAKNTAACLILAAARLAQQDPTQVMVVLPADHWIHPRAAFHRSLNAAIEMASETDRVVTIGIRPTRAHPGLGHLSAGAAIGRRHGCRIFRLRRFLEKPPRQTAEQLLHETGTYWNAGMFIGRVSSFLKLARQWLPRHAEALIPLARMSSSRAFMQRAADVYRPLDAVSFDRGIMAREQEGYVVEGTFKWEDLGSWDSWIRIAQSVKPGLAIASRNVRVISPDGHLIATVGLDDVTVVHTPDATLICRTHDAQAVRAVVTRLIRDRRLTRYV